MVEPTRIRQAIALLAATALTISGLAACSSGADHSGSGHGVSASATGTDAAHGGDIAFAQGMIPHHQQAIEMADLALGKSGTSSRVRELATAIKKTQDPEIATMRGWLAAWDASADAASGMHDGHGMMSTADMDRLKAAEGAQFDRMWLTMMIAHHEGAVTMAQQVLTTSRNAEVKALAQAVITAQQSEIATMKGLLSS